MTGEGSGIGGIIDSRPMSRFQIRTLFLGGLVLFADGFDGQTIGFLAPSISDGLEIPVNTFGPIFSAGLVGLMVGAMLAGPIADRWGRKWPIIFSTITLAIFSFLTASSTTFHQLFVYRFLTGLGLGGALPNVVALCSEYVPKRLMAVLVAILFCGLPLGGFICGMLASTLVPVWGWQSVFYTGGILPFVISLLMILLLPESVQFLSQQTKNRERVATLLSRIAPDITVPAGPRPSASASSEDRGMPVRDLFTKGRAAGTVLLWVPNFMNLLLMYVVLNWLPTLLTDSGMSVSDGVVATSFFSLGGILGTLVEGFLIRVGGLYRVLLVEFGLCAIFVAALAISADSWSLAVVLSFILGLLVIGGQAGLNVLAAQFYPTSVRSTGVGWALGMGRIGSILGPYIAGLFLARDWEPGRILLVGAVPALLALTAIVLSRPASTLFQSISGSDHVK